MHWDCAFAYDTLPNTITFLLHCTEGDGIDTTALPLYSAKERIPATQPRDAVGFGSERMYIKTSRRQQLQSAIPLLDKQHFHRKRRRGVLPRVARIRAGAGRWQRVRVGGAIPAGAVVFEQIINECIRTRMRQLATKTTPRRLRARARGSCIDGGCALCACRAAVAGLTRVHVLTLLLGPGQR